MASGPTRVKRSVTLTADVEFLKRTRSLKFVVSTTSVLPSQWPRESPFHCLMFLPTCGRAASSGISRALWIISVRTTTYPGPWKMSRLAL